MRTPLVICLLLAAIASSACHTENAEARQGIAEAALETCRPATRDEYESVKARLGEAPETPTYPEMATYQVCYARSTGTIMGNATIEDGGEADGDFVLSFTATRL